MAQNWIVRTCDLGREFPATLDRSLTHAGNVHLRRSDLSNKSLEDLKPERGWGFRVILAKLPLPPDGHPSGAGIITAFRPDAEPTFFPPEQSRWGHNGDHVAHAVPTLEAVALRRSVDIHRCNGAGPGSWTMSRG